MAALLTVTLPLAAAAHDGGTAMGISLSSERLPPTGALEIVGVGFLDGEIVDISLVGPQSVSQLGSVRAGPDGGFAVVLSVPAAATGGAYRVDAAVRSGIVLQADLVVDLAAGAPALTPTPADRLAPPPSGREDPVWIWAPLAAALIALGAFIVLVRHRMRAGRHDSPTVKTSGRPVLPG